MSTTAASRGTVPLARLASSAIVGSSPAGRLSATNQSRSSSDLAAVLRPAPDKPVMMTISCAAPSPFMLGPPTVVRTSPARRGPVAARRSPARPRGGVQRGIHRLCCYLAESRCLRDLLHRRGGQLAHRAELLEQRSPPGRPEARHNIEFA